MMGEGDCGHSLRRTLLRHAAWGNDDCAGTSVEHGKSKQHHRGDSYGKGWRQRGPAPGLPGLLEICGSVFRYLNIRHLPKSLLCIIVVAYALSPIDLIPEFSPVFGYIDDALLLPGLIWLAIRLLPTQVVDDCRARADAWMSERGTRPTSHGGAVLILALWLAIAYATWTWLKG